MGFLGPAQHPCTVDCPHRRPLVEKYGNCHNEHCPLGWEDYTARQNQIYEDRIRASNNNYVTAGKVKMARIIQRDRKKGRK